MTIDAFNYFFNFYILVTFGTVAWLVVINMVD